MQKLIFLIVFLSLSFTLFAQNRKILTPDGKLHSINEVEKIKQFYKGNFQTKEFTSPSGISEISDTLRYPGPWNSNFGFFGQDWMLMWFECPANLRLISAGFATNENDDAMPVELKIVMVNSSKEDLSTVGTAQHGWYEAAGNGYNDITAFSSNPDATGPWTSVSGGLPEPFGMDIWSEFGVGIPIIPVGGASTDYLWVDMSILYEPEFSEGDIFGIAIKHTGSYMDTNRIGLWASGVNPQWGWKFYANGRTSGDLTTAGWWTREFHWNFRAVVDLSSGPLPPIIVFTLLGTTISTEPRLVEAEVIGDPAVDQVWLMYSTNGGTNFTEIEMDGIEPNYSAYIPGMPPGTEVTYKIIATDVNGNYATTLPVVYNIFEVLNPNLVVFNGYTREVGDPYPKNYYFGEDVQNGLSTFPHDTWSYGALQEEIVEFYDNIFEFCTTGPKDYNDSVITNWLAVDGNRNYFLAGQEWFGLKNGFIDSTYVPGSFEYDILGITHSYNDVSYDGTSGQELPTLVFPQQGAMFGGPLFELFNANLTDSMRYDPNTIINVDNWVDAFDVVSGQEVDMTVETRAINVVPTIDTLPSHTHRILSNGNKIVFLSYDPLSLDSSPDSLWYGFTNENTPYQALQWFGIPVGVELEEKEIIPGQFSLSQNYPNPFNPSTMIRYEIPGQADNMLVVLKVYDVLGNEIAILVNEEKPAGEYEVEFNPASGIRNLVSGIYFYQLKAGSFIQTKKMILMK